MLCGSPLLLFSAVAISQMWLKVKAFPIVNSYNNLLAHTTASSRVKAMPDMTPYVSYSSLDKRDGSDESQIHADPVDKTNTDTTPDAGSPDGSDSDKSIAEDDKRGDQEHVIDEKKDKNERKDQHEKEDKTIDKSNNSKSSSNSNSVGEEEQDQEDHTRQTSHVVLPHVDPGLISDPLLRNVTLTYHHLHSHRPAPKVQRIVGGLSSSSIITSSNGGTPRVLKNKFAPLDFDWDVDMVPEPASADIEAFVGALRHYLASLSEGKRTKFVKAYLAHADEDDKYALERALGIHIVRHVHVHQSTSDPHNSEVSKPYSQTSEDSISSHTSKNSAKPKAHSGNDDMKLPMLLSTMTSPDDASSAITLGTDNFRTEDSVRLPMPGILSALTKEMASGGGDTLDDKTLQSPLGLGAVGLRKRDDNEECHCSVVSPRLGRPDLEQGEDIVTVPGFKSKRPQRIPDVFVPDSDSDDDDERDKRALHIELKTSGQVTWKRDVTGRSKLAPGKEDLMLGTSTPNVDINRDGAKRYRDWVVPHRRSGVRQDKAKQKDKDDKGRRADDAREQSESFEERVEAARLLHTVCSGSDCTATHKGPAGDPGK